MNRQNKNNNKKNNSTHPHKILSTDTSSIIIPHCTNSITTANEAKKKRTELNHSTSEQCRILNTEHRAEQKRDRKRKNPKGTHCVCTPI